MEFMAISLLVLALAWVLAERQGLVGRGRKVMDGAASVGDAIAQTVIEHFTEQLEKLRDVEELTEQRLQLEAQLADLRKEKADIEGEFSRKKRDLEHAAGLLKKELDAELQRVRAEASHEAEKRVLEVERDFNAKQMKFAEERFKGELETLNELVETLTARLPDVSASLRISEKRGR